MSELFENFSRSCNLSSNEAKEDTKRFHLNFVFDDASDGVVREVLEKQLVILWQQRNRKNVDKLQDGATFEVMVETLLGKRAVNSARHAKSVLDSMPLEEIQRLVKERQEREVPTVLDES